jgi:multiple sugar transport system permease protein
MNKKYKKIILYFVLLAVCMVVLFPLYWLVNTSIQTNEEIYSVPPLLFPKNNPIPLYIDYIKTYPILRWLLNSSIAALSTAVISVTLGLFAAFSLSRYNYKGKIIFIFLILMTQMLPPAFLIIPQYFLLTKIRIIDTYLALIFLYTAVSTPITTWFLKGFIDGVPEEIEDSAKIDGCNNFNLMIRIVFPLVLPGIIATGAWTFIISWNDFVIANTVINSDSLWTASVGVSSHIGAYYIDWNSIMIGGILTALPTLILFMIFQRYITSGLTAGSVKG